MYQLTNLKLVFFKILVLITLFGTVKNVFANSLKEQIANNIFFNT